MRHFGSSASKQKYKSTHQYGSSLSTLSNTTQGQSTKKNIQTQQIHSYQPQSQKDNNSKYTFNLPYTVQISEIVMTLSSTFSDDLLHVEEDYNGGKLLINGIKHSKSRKAFANVIDCLGMFCMLYGLRGGSIYDTYNVISICIKKQILNNRCLISIEHLNQNDRHNTFLSEVIFRIQEQLKKIDTSHSNDFGLNSDGPQQTKYLSEDSLFVQQINIQQKVFNIFIYDQDKRWNRFARLFQNSQKSIQEKIQKYYQVMKSNNSSTNKKDSKIVSSLIQSLIFESQSLYRALENYFEKENQEKAEDNFLQSLFDSTTQKQMTLYNIEHLLSLNCYKQILACYRQNQAKLCESFNQNCRQINLKYSNKQCFDYLQLKGKYRLEELRKPYEPSIQSLKMIPNSSSPRQLLLAFQKAFSSVKVDCLKYSKGRLQLSSMDQLLPVMIFITARGEVDDFPIFVKIIDDYVKFKNIFEVQERVITTLHVAVEDIAKRWKI